MKLRTLGFLFGEAFTNIRRNAVMSIASITTAMVSLFVFAIFLALTLNVEYMAHTVESKLLVRVFLTKNITASEMSVVKQKITTLPHVASIKYVSKSEALAQLKAEFGKQKNLLSSVTKTNPLLASFEIKASNPKYVNGLAKGLKQVPYVKSISYQQQVVSRLVQLVGAIRTGGLVMAVLLAVGALFIIQNAIRVAVFARRREISIMRLVGATPFLVRLPFLLEGLTLGLSGSFLAALLIWWGYHSVHQMVLHSLPFLPILGTRVLLSQIVLLLVLLGAGIGLLGSRLSLRRLTNV